MIKKLIMFCILFPAAVFAQVELRAGMGIDFTSAPSLTDYINQSYAPSNDQIGSFSAAINFSGEGGLRLSENFQMGLELAYSLSSYNYPGTSGNYEISYSNIMPSLTAYYVLPGVGYNFKFGGGAGIRLLSADEKRPLLISKEFTSTGLGILLRAEGNTLLGGNVYANIGADIRYNINGTPKNNGETIYNSASQEDVSFNSFSAGLRLGISYLF